MKSNQTMKTVLAMLTLLLLAGCGSEAYQQAEEELIQEEEAKAVVSEQTPPQTPDAAKKITLPGVGRD